MASSHPDDTEPRQAARDLHAALATGDRAAIDRVLAAHPKYRGRDESRLDGRALRLADAQAVVAVERGFTDWRALCAAHDGGAKRWREPQIVFHDRAAREAKQRGCDWIGTDHLLLALMRPPAPTVAATVLLELGASHDEKAALVPGGDEHALLALVFYDQGETLRTLDIDPDEVYDALVRHGTDVPPFRPPVAPTPLGPFGPRVYFPDAQLDVVLDAFTSRDELDAVHWGWNVSMWRPGHCWIDSEEDVDAAALVRQVVADASLVDVVDIELAAQAEQAAHESAVRAERGAIE
jgi:hypothetical protein